jgi:hypothetical protein
VVRVDGRIYGILRNPGKSFFLRLVAAEVNNINLQRDRKRGITNAQKAMIQTSLAHDVDNRWHIGQLNKKLKEIIARHPQHFQGEPILIIA